MVLDDPRLIEERSFLCVVLQVVEVKVSQCAESHFRTSRDVLQKLPLVRLCFALGGESFFLLLLLRPSPVGIVKNREPRRLAVLSCLLIRWHKNPSFGYGKNAPKVVQSKLHRRLHLSWAFCRGRFRAPTRRRLSCFSPPNIQ